MILMRQNGLNKELEICGFFGLKNKRELWRVQFLLSRIRKAARTLLKLEPSDKRRQFEGSALLTRLRKLGVLTEEKNSLDYVLSLTVEDFLRRRLQYQVAQNNLAKSIHHARVLVRHGHIVVNNRNVNIPSFLVHVDSARHIDFDVKSPFHASGGRPGRVKKRSLKNDKQ